MTNKRIWTILMQIFALTGIMFGVWGFKKHCCWTDSFYETLRLFVFNLNNEIAISWQIEFARWLIFLAFLIFSFRLFFEILAPDFFKNQIIKLFYRNHIVICGLNKITISLLEKFDNEKIVVLAEETNKYVDIIKTKGSKLLISNFSDKSFWKKAKLERASKLFIINENDKVNVNIAQSIFSFLERKEKKNGILKCFILIQDRKLKFILEETDLFKYKTIFFDGSIININEMGIKYSIAMNIDKILPKKITTAPKILFVGLTEKTIIVLLNLAHCLTMKQEEFEFVIIEKNEKTQDLFRKKYAYLWDFGKIKFVEKIETDQQYNSIFICSKNSTRTIHKAVSVRNILSKNEPNIFVFHNNSDTFCKVFYKLEDRNIVMLNLFETISNYIFDLEIRKSRKIEEKAKETHYFWNDIYKMNKEWETLSGHFKQSNRNQVLDNYLRTYIALGEKFEDMKNRLISISDKNKKTLAMMEHRRWMLEKYENGWTKGTRNDEFKRHDCLIHWDELPKKQQLKDEIAIDLMIKLLNNQSE